MSDSMGFETPNLREWLAELYSLPRVIQERVVKGTVATGASVIRKAAVQRAPMWSGKVSAGHPPPGTLKRAIYQTRLPEECSATREVWKVDVRRGKSAVSSRGKNKGKRMLGSDAFYALWVEYGHYTRTPGMTSKQHRKARGGVDVYTGSKWVPARPYMRPAFEANKDDAMQAMQKYLNENLGLAAGTMRYLTAISGAVPA